MVTKHTLSVQVMELLDRVLLSGKSVCLEHILGKKTSSGISTWEKSWDLRYFESRGDSRRDQERWPECLGKTGKTKAM